VALMRSKLTLVVLSAILVGGAGAVLAGMSAVRPPSYSSALAANGSTGATNTTGSGPTATTASTARSSATPTDTSVPTPRPTRTPTPIPVPGQTLTVHGDVTSISAGTFVVSAFGGGGSYTITVSSSTVWPNPLIPDLQHLQVGMQVDARGTYAGGGSLNPTNSVDADN
jgi:hypothetical protein